MWSCEIKYQRIHPNCSRQGIFEVFLQPAGLSSAPTTAPSTNPQAFPHTYIHVYTQGHFPLPPPSSCIHATVIEIVYAHKPVIKQINYLLGTAGSKSL